MRAGLFISACEPGGSLDRDPDSGIKHPSWRRLTASPCFWPALLLTAAVFWAGFYNLANYPKLWWDEAIFSETAANVVQHGRYAFTVESPNQLPPAVVQKYWQKVARLDCYDIYVRRSSALLRADFPVRLSQSPSLPIP